MSYSMDDLDRRGRTSCPGLYSENIKRGVLDESIAFVNGRNTLDDITSNLTDHNIPVHLMSAVYLSHIKRQTGDNPIVNAKMKYNGKNPVLMLSESDI